MAAGRYCLIEGAAVIEWLWRDVHRTGVVTGQVTGSFQFDIDEPYLAASWSAAGSSVESKTAQQAFSEPPPH